MVDSNGSTIAVGPENVYLDQQAQYYLAASPRDPGDSRIPYPTPQLVASIRGSKTGFTSQSEMADVMGKVPGPQEALTHTPGTTEVSDEPHSVETVATTNSGEALKEPTGTSGVAPAPEPEPESETAPEPVTAPGPLDHLKQPESGTSAEPIAHPEVDTQEGPVVHDSEGAPEIH